MMTGQLSKELTIGLAIFAAFVLGGAVGYKYSESRYKRSGSGPEASKTDTQAVERSRAQILAKVQQQVVARQRFANELQTYLKDQNFDIFVDTRSLPNPAFGGDLHDVLKLNCGVCGQKKLAQALLDIATPPKLRELGFLTFMVGTFQSRDYWVWDVRESKWLEGKQPAQKTW